MRFTTQQRIDAIIEKSENFREVIDGIQPIIEEIINEDNSLISVNRRHAGGYCK